MREWTIRHHIAGMEFVGVDKSARYSKGGHCRSGQCGTMWQGWTMREWTMQEWSNACEKCVYPLPENKEESYELCAHQMHQSL